MEMDEGSPLSSDRKATMNHVLRRRILTMRLAPGAVVDEVALSEEFGLSRPPVRELMRQMAGEGYIELEANRPARVASMSYQSLRDFFLVAPMIYVATTKLAAENARPSEIEALKLTQSRFKEAIRQSDIDGRVFLNDEFHLSIGKMAHNPYLLPSLRRLLIDHGRIAKIFYRPNNAEMQGDLDTASNQHDEIIEAIESRNGERAAEITRAHLDLSRKNIAMYATPEGMDMHLGGAVT
ncbi:MULTISPECIES: GntR family transcriptional regulator [unclassified Mesorhizobium]|uniref:GntR family transcriptional regulator n=1 Tax=unclassified Mesorhizobium TaxID=325217 RepID=UPI000BAF5899|nr:MULTISPECIES: GntR family transcriptional regulator [unclassified Mesorhizobium]TGT58570.1 GntR family transcriptional regulator [Mesorhizobium sp. M00.F.Ca.ET.170.01.1.1]AZO12035.1 GntR family transcriptional regulator [Mesorhizobium sp. M3A.F.Ca.ET.080.04.2.1]PBB84324.1 GntR family transcriptional regulator [Mesorhizobium sp. WSM3876]RWB74751.1 MAG: GntR family transcriptional regulator [Mesorhizobium sp.]RWB89790.1 MAG: GntR family transcriptional regulator [Mesorhizobium sp.]